MVGKTVEMIDFGMFKTAYGKKFKTPGEQDKPMREAFKILDADNDGTISEAELRQMLLTVGEPLTHQEVSLSRSLFVCTFCSLLQVRRQIVLFCFVLG
jgi:Ca2+-binding EF-hand superfamily protein